MISALFSDNSRSSGLFATYERNYSYLEAKGDIDTQMPTSDDLFQVAGFVVGMPITRKKLEKILKTKKLQSLYASGSPEVFYYKTWFNPCYKKTLEGHLESFVLEESRRLFLDCVTVEVEKSTSIKRTLKRNTNKFCIL